MRCPPDCHAHPPAIETCEPRCREHRNHIYIICYGKAVKVRDRDYLHADRDAWGSGYPITHYVGFTTQLPVDRVRQHAAFSAHYLVEVRPGWETDELHAKLYEKCPRCGGSLWYFAESPTYKRRYRRQKMRELRRQRQRLIELRRQRRTLPRNDEEKEPGELNLGEALLLLRSGAPRPGYAASPGHPRLWGGGPTRVTEARLWR
jgi:hypothetical protein